MKEYLDVLQKILDEGVEKESGRANMPNTIGISKADIAMDLSKGFPLLTTKKMYWKGIVCELLWFLRGETNIKYLVDNNVNIWNGDAYRWYLKWRGNNSYYLEDEKELSQEEFVEEIKKGNLQERQWSIGSQGDKKYKLGDLGKVYGAQWRNQNGVDQVKDVVEGLKSNPYSRYHIIDGWNKADFPDMALPPCHLLYQFIVRPLSAKERWDLFQDIEWDLPFNIKDTSDDTLHSVCDQHDIPRFYLDLNMYQRSVDTPLGCPFNIASMSLLLMIIAEASNMIAGVANWIGGDTHIYLNQIEGVKEQLLREPFPLPKMIINKELNSLEDILNLTINDFTLKDYKSHSKIKFTLSVGL